MTCFCTVPADEARNRFNMAAVPVLPPAPLTMKLAVALPAIAPDDRLDMQIATGFDPVVLPHMSLFGGPMMQMSMMLSMMSGSFTLDDLPMLEFQMEQAAASITRNVWPRLGWLTTLKIQPLINFAIVARLVLDLRALGLDPFTMSAFPEEIAGPRVNSYNFALTRPKLHMAKLMAGLPPLMQLNETLNLPPLGDPGAVSALQNRLQGLAKLTPPHLAISLPMLQKLALALQSLATIEEAFGENLNPSTLGPIRMMLSRWGHFALPIPLPDALMALTLNEKLDLLPAMEDIRLGESVAGSMNTAFAAASFTPPRLAIAPFMNVVMALQGSFQMALEVDPFDMCSLCPCA